MCLTGAQFIFPRLGHNKTVTTEEDATLNVEFRIRSQCNSSLNLLSTIDVRRPSKKQQGSENTERVCQFVHVNGSCEGGTSECQCPANSTGPYTLVQTADRSYNGTWTWSSDPPLVQQTGLDVIVRCKYLSFFVLFVCLVLVCFRMCKSPPPPLPPPFFFFFFLFLKKEVFDRSLDENAIFCPPKQAKHKNQTITLLCKKERRLKDNYNAYFLLLDKNGGKI